MRVVLLTRHDTRTRTAAAAATDATHTTAALAVVPPARPITRKITINLPFASKFVSLDETAREVTPPSDLQAFEVPASSGPRHRVTAVGVDGTRAEGFVREVEGATGVVKVEPEGFLVEGARCRSKRARAEHARIRRAPRDAPRRDRRWARRRTASAEASA